MISAEGKIINIGKIKEAPSQVVWFYKTVFLNLLLTMSSFQRGCSNGYVTNGDQLNNFEPRSFYIVPRVYFMDGQDLDYIPYNNIYDKNK